MANSFNDLTQVAYTGVTFRPQVFSSTGAGLTVDADELGTNLLNAMLETGAVSALTSLVVKMQASTDDSGWDDIAGAVFTTVTAANAREMISFQLPTAASATDLPYKYVRAYATLTGTSIAISCTIIGNKKYPSPTLAYQNSPGVIN